MAIRAFDWRDDATGGMLARTLMAAADRGVRVTVLKDVMGASYEYAEGARQSFLHKRIDARTRRQALGLQTAYGSFPWIAPRSNPLAEAFVRHPNITVERDRRRRDHSKVYVIDDEILFVGGIGIGNEHVSSLDFMVEVEDREAVERYHARVRGAVAFDAARPLDFLVHTVEVHGRASCALLEERLRLFGAARSRIVIEMGFLGDARITDALVAAVDRGVAVTLVVGRKASVIGDLNLATCDELLVRAGAPPHLRVVIHPRSVHGKAIVIDGEAVDLGSANFTTLSHGAYDEVNVFVRDASFARAVETAIERHASEGQLACGRVRYNRLYARVERHFVRQQTRSKSA